ncbi:unnamed protein product [Withania somnifera]
MDGIGVLLMRPLSSYDMILKLSKRFILFKYWEIPSESLNLHLDSIRAVVGNGLQGVNSELIDSLPRLEIVSSHSSGLDKIDLVKCKERGIRVTSTPDALTDDVADMAILLTLATLRRICEADRFVKKGIWKQKDFSFTAKFSSKSVGIVGLGRTGLAIAKRAKAFGCSISYYSRSQKPVKILVVACVLTDETHHIINREVTDALGPNGVVINIARGSHIDESELVSALAEGR